MHDSVMRWVGDTVDSYGLTGDILEVGSFDVNGSVRDFFGDCRSYHGIDVRPGPGVDEVVEPGLLWYYRHELLFDVVVSTEMLEHDPRPWRTIEGMGMVLRFGGHLVLTCRGFGDNGAYGLHDDPVDYWRPHARAVRIMLEDAGLMPRVVMPDTDETAPGVFAVAKKL